MFVSVDGKAKKVLEIFAGGTDGKAKRVTELFGSVNGIARLLFSMEPPATNNFDKFTWAEIKQFANEGKLLEHFNLYDRVTVQLKTPLENDLTMHIDSANKSITVHQKQTEMVFQIVELTATKMRLMCPRVSVFGSRDSDISIGADSSIYGLFGSDWYYNRNSARSYCNVAWGMTSCYGALKQIQNALPDDLVDVLSIWGRPLISWKLNSITNSVTQEFDDNCKVGQLSTNKFSSTTKTGDDGIIYPVIKESYFPTTISDYLYHITLPEEYDTYEDRKALVKRMFDGFSCFDHRLSGTYYYQSWCNAPEMSCAYTRGFTTSAEYSEYTSGGQMHNDLPIDTPMSCEVVFPEIIIKADA